MKSTCQEAAHLVIGGVKSWLGLVESRDKGPRRARCFPDRSKNWQTVCPRAFVWPDVGFQLRGSLQSQSRIGNSADEGYLLTLARLLGHQTREVPMKYLLALLLLLVSGCTEHPYTVCRGEDFCTPALTHEEAIKASEIKKTWNDEKLYVRPVRNREAT